MPPRARATTSSSIDSATLERRDFNAYFYEPVLRHPTLTTAELLRMVDEGTAAFYSVRKVARRISKILLGGRSRTVAPIEYIARQIAPMVGKMSRLFVIQQVTGGLFRRGARHCAPRAAISDEEARAYYLPRLAPLRRRIPASMRDEARMESLPILRHHQIEAFENA